VISRFPFFAPARRGNFCVPSLSFPQVPEDEGSLSPPPGHHGVQVDLLSNRKVRIRQAEKALLFFSFPPFVGMVAEGRMVRIASAVSFPFSFLFFFPSMPSAA